MVRPVPRAPMEDRDATGRHISAQRAVPDRASAGPDRGDRRRQPAGCRGL